MKRDVNPRKQKMVGGTLLLATGVKYVDEELNISYATLARAPLAVKGVTDPTAWVVPPAVLDMSHPMLTLTLAQAIDLPALTAPVKTGM